LNKDVSIGTQDAPQVKEKVIYGTGCIFELTKWLLLAIIILIMVNVFVVTIFIIDGMSMEPNYHSGELVIANRWQYLFGTPDRYDAVILKFPGDPEHKKYIKRVIGLPGETVEIKNGLVYINGNKLSEPYLPNGTLTLPDLSRNLGSEDYFLLGDNRDNSSDSRIWGVAPRRDLVARAWVVVWPVKYFQVIK
jgi:signal peptidase I